MIAERAIDVHHGINRQMPRRNKEIIWFYFTLCLLLQNTKLTMSVDGAATSVVDLFPVSVFFSLAAMSGSHGQARLCPGANGLDN